MAVPTFVDRVTLFVSAGRGGNGVASVHREKFKPLGGPDGGNGGPGGSVILRVDPDVTTLIDYHHSAKRSAENGGHGAGSHRNGSHGADLVLPVPEGTVVTDRDGTLLADLMGPGTEMVIASGGRGGLGNAALASSKRKAPGFALLGEPGDELEIRLELKVVADIGLVGFPSAGKSSLIAAVSRARPKIADYPFTTLVPNLGVVKAGDTTFTVADVPGLIEGAADGRGLGHDFLRHIERCAAIVHVVDTASIEPGRNPADDLDVIENELHRYGGLEDRPRLVALNKIDVPDGRDIAEMVAEDLGARGLRVFPVSAASGEGLRELTFAMAEIVDRARRARPVSDAQRIVIRPASVDGQDDFSVKLTGEGWRIRGEKPERWVRQTDFSNDEAVGFLADRLNRLGVETRLVKLGAKEGDTVLIGHPDNAVVFDFKPGLDAGAEMLGRRGEDQRFEESRPARPASPRHRRRHARARGDRDPGRRRPPPRPSPGAPAPCRTRSARPTTRTGPTRTPAMTRTEVTSAKRVVVKVGSSSLTTAAGGIDPDRVRALVDVLAAVRRRGVEVVLVSSGAIAAGLAPLRMKRRPRALPAQQAAASVGQGLLVHRYTEELARHDIVTGQVLLTVDDVTRRSHYRNAYQTFAKLLELGVLPIVNENDALADDELRFGDNDRLAALVAHLVHADLLVLLCDVDGLYDADPGAAGSSLLTDVSRSEADLARTSGSARPAAAGVGTGGMQTKLEAAGSPPAPGIPVVLTSADLRRRRPRRRPGRHALPLDRQAAADPAAVAGARDRAQGDV